MNDKTKLNEAGEDDFNTMAYGLVGVNVTAIMDSAIGRLGLDPRVAFSSVMTELMLHRQVDRQFFLDALNMAEKQVEEVRELTAAAARASSVLDTVQ